MNETQNEPGARNANAQGKAPPQLHSTQLHAHKRMVAEMLESSTPRQRALLGILAATNRHQLDPAPLINSLAAEFPRRAKFQANTFAQRISDGEDMFDTLEETPNVLSASSVLALRLAKQTGTLPDLFAAYLDRPNVYDAPSTALHDDLFAKFSRLFVQTTIICSLLTFMMLKIIPEFGKMLEEFGVETPGLMRLLIKACSLIAMFWFIFPLLFLLLLPFFIPAFRRYLRRWNPVTWRQRHFAPSENRRRSLAMISETGIALPAGLAMVFKNKYLRKIFKKSASADSPVETGKNEWNSLASKRIISKREAKSLSLATGGDTQAWLLRWFASSQQNKRSTRISLIARTVIVAINVGLCILVVLAAVAVFSTLIQIMAGLS